MTVTSPDVTIGVEACTAEIRSWFSRHRDLGTHVVVRRRDGEIRQVFTSSDDPAELCAQAQACAETWAATYVGQVSR